MLAEFSSFADKPFFRCFLGMTGYTEGLVAVLLHKQAFNEAIPAHPAFKWVNYGMDVVYLYVLIPYAL
jgi:ABC-type uncharacterized transport system permease subunit